jgi:tetratricopeptide (TPR) repeat protein
MALANQSRFAEAKHELNELRQVMKDSSLRLPFTPFSPAIDGAKVAENILAGTIALKEMDYTRAIEVFKIAVATEENMVYNEPRDWMLNAKHFLGNAYLAAGQPAAAQQVLEKDLVNNRENGWALFGIWQALSAENKKTEAVKVLARYRKAFEKADVTPTGPVF